MTAGLLTPSKITAWLDCAHYLTLRHQVDDGALPQPAGSFGSFAELLAKKGMDHESECLAEYRRRGMSVLEIDPRGRGEAFATWVERVGDPFGLGYDVIYQMPLVHGGIRGVADFLVRIEDPVTGAVGYEPVDAKLARAEAKPGHVLQLCFYADALEAVTGTAPRNLHLWLGSGKFETLVADDFRPYWRRMRGQLAAVLEAGPTAEGTVPEPCNHCAFCEFGDVCEQQWRSQDALHYVAGIRRQDRAALDDAAVSTLTELAKRQDPVEGVRPERLERLVGQAGLQVEARQDPEGPPPYRVIEPSDDPTWGRGFALMPEPDHGDVFLDFEGHPFWRADTGLFFLLGLILREDDGRWGYRAWWSHDLGEGAAATQSLIDFLAHRRSEHPGMHVYHYNHTERSALERLAVQHSVGEVVLAELVETGLFVDLLVVARNALQAGVESYGLKHLERLTDFERGHDIDKGAGAVIEYERFMADGDPKALDRIAAYNEDDVRATMALRDWLIDQRPLDTPWRAAFLEPIEPLPELDAQVTALHAFGADTHQHLLGDVLGYWRREWFAQMAPKLARSQGDTPKLLDDPDALAGLTPVGLVQRTGKKGQPLKHPGMRFSVPQQVAHDFKGQADQVIYSTPEGTTGYATIDRLDLAGGEVDLVWNERAQGLAIPSVLMLNDWVPQRPKPEALSEFAAQVLDPDLGPPNGVSLALLRRDLPTFAAGGGPLGGRFSDDLDEMTSWVKQLDHSYVAIQGPPGTGKTYRGAHLIRSLILADRRVGITAMSHHAINNLLKKVVELFQRNGEVAKLNAVKKGKPSSGALAGVTYVETNPPCEKLDYNLVAGTTWLFSRKEMKNAPVDVLLVDEAGQLALADALAAARSARNLVLLGDPLQLPQVAQAAHPGGGGLSVLEHVLGDDVTIPATRGVFLPETRRMHPDVCKFISEQIYQGRLTSYDSCAKQATEFGTGLRWLRAHHVGRSTEAPEEADLVAEHILRLLGTPWTNHKGERQPLKPLDLMVVAPYNDQVNLLRARLDQDSRSRGVPVGTVDKFQGQQAAVVFFTMTTSSAEDMSRSAEFLFSRNRLNVAVSRARCLAYLVCTEELLNSRARNVEDMRLISTLCAFVEHSQKP